MCLYNYVYHITTACCVTLLLFTSISSPSIQSSSISVWAFQFGYTHKFMPHLCLCAHVKATSKFLLSFRSRKAPHFTAKAMYIVCLAETGMPCSPTDRVHAAVLLFYIVHCIRLLAHVCILYTHTDIHTQDFQYSLFVCNLFLYPALFCLGLCHWFP